MKTLKGTVTSELAAEAVCEAEAVRLDELARREYRPALKDQLWLKSNRMRSHARRHARRAFTLSPHP